MSLSVRQFSRAALVALGLMVSAGCGGSGSDSSSVDPGDDPNANPGSGAGEGAGNGSGNGAGNGSGNGTGSGVGSSMTPGDPSSSVDAATTGNPFTGANMYVNPDYALEVDSSIAMSPGDGPLLEKMKSIPTAIWLDRIAMVPKVIPHLDRALKQQNDGKKPSVIVFVIYDLPNRDCHAKASNGELHVADGGLEKYKKEYIDPIAAAFKAYKNQRIVAIVEPDSLPNLATNLSDPTCAAAESAYREASAYAIKSLAAPNVFMYLDVGHAGWLGWTDNQTKAAKVFKEVLDAAGGPNLIRGFASNVANYSVLHEGPELFDYMYNPCHDELTYQKQLSASFKAAGITNTAWLIDTSRNGRGGIRHQWGYWCNNKGAGVGERPKADPSAGIDAYYWVKPPGESDGTSDPTAARFDAFCGYEDAHQGAPEAGQWFHSYFVEAVKNANPPL